MGSVVRFAAVLCIVAFLALGACAQDPKKEPSQPMDGSTAGANAATLEQLETQHAESRQ